MSVKTRASSLYPGPEAEFESQALWAPLVTRLLVCFVVASEHMFVAETSVTDLVTCTFDAAHNIRRICRPCASRAPCVIA